VWNAGQVYLRTHLYVDTAPTADTTLISFGSNTATIGELRLSMTGALQIRASGVQVAITPAGITPTGTSVWIEGFYDSLRGQMQLKVFTGSTSTAPSPTTTRAARRLGRQPEHHRLQPRPGHRDHGDVYFSRIVFADNWIGRASDPVMMLLGGKSTPAAISIDQHHLR